MAVHLVFRCFYNAPDDRHVRRFEAETVLDWVRSIWKPIPEEDQADQYADKLLGGIDIGLSRMFQAIAEEQLPPPETMEQVLSSFWNFYSEEEDHGPHHLQVLGEKNDLQVAIYLFDDHFRATAPGLTDFLLLDGWELPGTWLDTGLPSLLGNARLLHSGDGEGTLYAVSMLTDCKYNLEDLDGGWRIEGARVPDLCRYVLTYPNEADQDYGLRAIRGGLQNLLVAPGGEDAGFLSEIRDNPGETVHWLVYSDWLQERGQPPAGLYLLEAALRAAPFASARETRDPALDRIKVFPHLAQAYKHEERWTGSSFRGPVPCDSFTQWIYFDDRWVAAHPTLASGILRFASRWDVLSSGGEEDQE
jgi:uncharacterized protein (TIGR02996 family)